MKQEQNNIQDKWVTHFEKSGGLSSPGFEETMRYFEHFTRDSHFAKMITLGFSPQGRPMRCMIVSNNREFTAPKARDSGKLIVLIQNGIHAGEIEGKDATMLLLREILITKEKEHLLKNLILL
ncbi:MAG: M14 family zinc carboxypeptidase, partial [Ignavibacteriaceae bacterium]